MADLRPTIHIYESNNNTWEDSGWTSCQANTAYVRSVYVNLIDCINTNNGSEKRLLHTVEDIKKWVNYVKELYPNIEYISDQIFGGKTDWKVYKVAHGIKVDCSGYRRHKKEPFQMLVNQCLRYLTDINLVSVVKNTITLKEKFPNTSFVRAFYIAHLYEKHNTKGFGKNYSNYHQPFYNLESLIEEDILQIKNNCYRENCARMGFYKSGQNSYKVFRNLEITIEQKKDEIDLKDLEQFSKIISDFLDNPNKNMVNEEKKKVEKKIISGRKVICCIPSRYTTEGMRYTVYGVSGSNILIYNDSYVYKWMSIKRFKTL